MVRAPPVSWQSEPVERFDARTGHEGDNRFANMKYDTLRHPSIDRETRDEIRANQAAARRMLIKLNRAETFASRFEVLSDEVRRRLAEQLPVGVAFSARVHRLRERYERHSGGVTIEQRQEIREQLEHAARTGDLTVEDIIARSRDHHRNGWSSTGFFED